MNTSKLRKMLGLCLSFAVILSISGCKGPEMVFDDKILMVSQRPQYEVALGKRVFYVLAGKYKGLGPGAAVDLYGNIYTFSIGELLKRNPSLKTERNLKEALSQQVEFKRKHSRLYDPRLEL